RARPAILAAARERLRAAAGWVRRRQERHCVTDSKTVQRDATAEDDLLYEVHDGIGRVTFNRPQARNALTFAMYERLKEICDAANTDRSLKAQGLTGEGDQECDWGAAAHQAP